MKPMRFILNFRICLLTYSNVGPSLRTIPAATEEKKIGNPHGSGVKDPDWQLCGEGSKVD